MRGSIDVDLFDESLDSPPDDLFAFFVGGGVGGVGVGEDDADDSVAKSGWGFGRGGGFKVMDGVSGFDE